MNKSEWLSGQHHQNKMDRRSFISGVDLEQSFLLLSEISSESPVIFLGLKLVEHVAVSFGATTSMFARKVRVSTVARDSINNTLVLCWPVWLRFDFGLLGMLQILLIGVLPIDLCLLPRSSVSWSLFFDNIRAFLLHHKHVLLILGRLYSFFSFLKVIYSYVRDDSSLNACNCWVFWTNKAHCWVALILASNRVTVFLNGLNYFSQLRRSRVILDNWLVVSHRRRYSGNHWSYRGMLVWSFFCF